MVIDMRFCTICGRERIYKESEIEEHMKLNHMKTILQLCTISYSAYIPDSDVK
jgi:hypothetical protein